MIISDDLTNDNQHGCHNIKSCLTQLNPVFDLLSEELNNESRFNLFYVHFKMRWRFQT